MEQINLRPIRPALAALGFLVAIAVASLLTPMGAHAATAAERVATVGLTLAAVAAAACIFALSGRAAGRRRPGPR